MESSQVFAAILLVPVALQILLPLAMLLGFAVIGPFLALFGRDRQSASEERPRRLQVSANI